MRISALLLPLASSLLLPSVASAAQRVWVIDDGLKIKRDATALPQADGKGNAVWAPGQPVKLFSLRDETVALQLVVQADATALSGVTVELPSLVGPAGATIANAPGATDPTRYVGRPIERFVEHYFDVTRASGGSTAGESLGWSNGSGPAPGEWTGWIPDALVPVESAPSWEPYPMNVAPQSNAVVWIDITVPRSQPAGTYAGAISVAAGGQTLASIPVQLDVAGATLPDLPVATMLYYDPGELSRKIGDPAAEANLWKLYHRHRLRPMHDAETVDDVTRAIPALDGSAYTTANGYDGPGVGEGDGILSLGAYGALGAPSQSALPTVTAMADAVADHGLFASTDVFLYATDESCGSSYGQGWKDLLASSTDPNASRVLVGWTCSQDPSTQPVDVPIVMADGYDPSQAQAARALGKKPWIYNGVRPQTDAFLTDTAAVALRADGWIAAAAGIERWFYWETTFWFDDNPGGHGAYDPFVAPETFHNQYGDWCEGDGVLVYPGVQVDQFAADSVGIHGVLPSIRLKELRRGIEDAGYYQLASVAAPAQAQAVASALLGSTLSAAQGGRAVSWTEDGAAWFAARKALLDLVPQQLPAPAVDAGSPPVGVVAVPPPVGVGAAAGSYEGDTRLVGASSGCAVGGANEGTRFGALALLCAIAATRRRRSPRGAPPEDRAPCAGASLRDTPRSGDSPGR